MILPPLNTPTDDMFLYHSTLFTSLSHWHDFIKDNLEIHWIIWGIWGITKVVHLRPPSLPITYAPSSFFHLASSFQLLYIIWLFPFQNPYLLHSSIITPTLYPSYPSIPYNHSSLYVPALTEGLKGLRNPQNNNLRPQRLIIKYCIFSPFRWALLKTAICTPTYKDTLNAESRNLLSWLSPVSETWFIVWPNHLS